MNTHSSHALLIAKIEKNFEHKTNKEHLMTSSYLYLVDLTESERINKCNKIRRNIKKIFSFRKKVFKV